MPFVRKERAWRVVTDYSAKVDEEIDALWAARAQLVLKGEKCEVPAHSEEYLMWYGEYSIMFIGRSAEREHAVPSQANDTSNQPEPTIPSIPHKHV